MRGLLIVDIQPDFCEGGALAVNGGNDVAWTVAKLLEGTTGFYPFVVTSQDWHNPLPDLNGGHFAAPGEAPDYVTTWPVHCVAGTPGAELHPDLLAPLSARLGRTVAIRKGQGRPDYSAFQGIDSYGQHTLETTLALRGVTALDVVGLATDHCVYQSAIGALALPRLSRVRVIEDLCAGVSPEATNRALDDLRNLGAEIITADTL